MGRKRQSPGCSGRMRHNAFTQVHYQKVMRSDRVQLARTCLPLGAGAHAAQTTQPQLPLLPQTPPPQLRTGSFIPQATPLSPLQTLWKHLPLISPSTETHPSPSTTRPSFKRPAPPSSFLRSIPVATPSQVLPEATSPSHLDGRHLHSHSPTLPVSGSTNSPSTSLHRQAT